MTSPDSRPPDRFATTRWSVVMRHADAPSGNARDALGELARRYWYPVYVYMRRCGHAPPAAEQLARQFLPHLLADSPDSGAPGPYRGYLLSRLHAFLAADAHGPIDESLPVPADLETRYQQDQLGQLSPEQSFQRAFALQVLNRTLRRLRGEASQTGHGDMYESLEPFLARDAAPGEYEFIATRLKCRPLTVVVALKRLRQRFRELAAEELVDTVSSADDLVAEQNALLAVLGGIHP
jgi:RNA polymerase sigma-70 factor (ECF subfamily)